MLLTRPSHPPPPPLKVESLLFHIQCTVLIIQLLLGCLGSVFPSGTNRALACSARAQDISVCLECVE